MEVSYIVDGQERNSDDDQALCFKWLDTELEKKIDLGVSWPFQKLNPLECIIMGELAT